MDVSKVLAVSGSGREAPRNMDLINERLSGTIELIARTLESMRSIATELRPPVLDAFWHRRGHRMADRGI